MRHGKRYRAAAELVSQAGQVKDLAEAVKLVKQTARAKFDETIVVSSHLGVDPRHSDHVSEMRRRLGASARGAGGAGRYGAVAA